MKAIIITGKYQEIDFLLEIVLETRELVKFEPNVILSKQVREAYFQVASILMLSVDSNVEERVCLFPFGFL